MTRRLTALTATLLLAAGACESERTPTTAAPTRPRAMLVLEPPTLGVGEVAVLELAVVTPPDHRVRPFKPPESTPGVWLLDAEPAALERREARWIQRTRLRVRAREVGRFTWPEGQVEVEDPDGGVASLVVASLDFEVVSVLPEHPDRLAPFGVRAPPEPDPFPAWLAGGAGAGLALALVGLVAWTRRARSARARPARVPIEPPWVSARREIEDARAALGRDPVEAADRGAVALRRYVAGRFGADTVARTTEELGAATPPFGALSRWPRFVSLLEALDALRFVPTEGAERARDRARALLDEIEGFVEETRPGDAAS